MDIWALASIIAKFALYAGVLFAAGTVFFAIQFDTERARAAFQAPRLAGSFALLGIASTVAGYFIQAARLAGEAAGMLDAGMLAILWDTPAGTASWMRLAGLGLLLLGLCAGRFGRYLSLFGAAIALASFTQIGHAADSPSAIAQAALLVHLVGISLWVGILLPLEQLTSEPELSGAAGEVAHRFGSAAVIFVPMLLIAGGLLAFELVGSIGNLLATPFGWMILAKIALVLALLGLGAANKLRFVPALRAGDPSACAKLNRSVRIETALVLLILLATATLTSVLTPPEMQP